MSSKRCVGMVHLLPGVAVLPRTATPTCLTFNTADRYTRLRGAASLPLRDHVVLVERCRVGAFVCLCARAAPTASTNASSAIKNQIETERAPPLLACSAASVTTVGSSRSSFDTKASQPPLKVGSKAPGVAGKLLEYERPVTMALPVPSMATA